MKLNYDCVRDALLFIESIDYINESESGIIEFEEVDISCLYTNLPEYKHEDIYYALFNLEQAGLINASSLDADSGVCDYVVNYITYSGHEFLEHIKPTTIWESTKSTLSKVGAISIDIITQVASNVLTNLLISKT